MFNRFILKMISLTNRLFSIRLLGGYQGMSNVFFSDARVKMPVLHETKDGCNMRRDGINCSYLSECLDGLWYIAYMKISGLRK